MQNVSFDNSDEKDVVVQRPEHADAPSKSEIANWLAEHKIIKTRKRAEVASILVALLIIVIAGAIFAYGVGKRQTNEMKQTGNVHLKKNK